MEDVVMVVPVRWWLWESSDKKKTVEGEPQTLQFVKNFRFPRRLQYGRGGCTTPGGFCQGVFVFRAETMFHVELF